MWGGEGEGSGLRLPSIPSMLSKGASLLSPFSGGFVRRAGRAAWPGSNGLPFSRAHAAGDRQLELGPAEIPAAGNRKLGLSPTEVTQQSRRVPAIEGRITVTPSTAERDAWPLLAGSAQQGRVLGSDSFRADSSSQTPDLQDPDFPPGSQIKADLQ